jgi:peptidoglycan-N-acetylglucosamine deacetylase
LRKASVIGINSACVSIGGALLGAAYGVRGRSSQLFGPSIYRGRGKRKSIALTFDDGPSEGSLALVDYLERQQVKATFFQCGMNVQRHPEIARNIYAAGHEIGNHTYSHARLCPRISREPNLLSPEAIYSELSRAQQAIQNETGANPTLFRAPYGLRWFGLAEAQRRLSLLGVMWTVIGNDWKWPAQRIAELVLRKSDAGGIICLHDGRNIQSKPDISETLLAVRKIIPALKDNGYLFETVSELLTPERTSRISEPTPGPGSTNATRQDID